MTAFGDNGLGKARLEIPPHFPKGWVQRSVSVGPGWLESDTRGLESDPTCPDIKPMAAGRSDCRNRCHYKRLAVWGGEAMLFVSWDSFLL